ncbi:MAG: sulfatase-like hydrolase/transferase, partial [Chlorobi bacterium]|nr:sulfatase-like hydrolase/transferase [Chlorobiota bacterium]
MNDSSSAHRSYTLAVILGAYALYLGLMTILRAAFWWLNAPAEIRGMSPARWLKVLVEGWRFDLVPFTYGMGITLILLLLYAFSGRPFFRRAAFWWTWFWTALLLAVYVADTVFYRHFSTHADSRIFFWVKDPRAVAGMIFQSPSMWVTFIPIGIFLYVLYRLLRRIFQNRKGLPFPRRRPVQAAVGIPLLAVMFFTAKGRIIGHALSADQAFTDEHFFVNDFKINPFFILRSSMGQMKQNWELDLMDNDEALRIVRKEFGIDTMKYNSPVARDYTYGGDSINPNIVLIFLERKAAWKMAYFGNRDSLTPVLDSLFLRGLAFDHFYSSGTVTYEGIFGTLYGYPILFSEHPLYGTEVNNDQRIHASTGKVKTYYGLPQVLAEWGYLTAYFCPHSPAFDNMGVFLPQNGFR